MPPPALAIRIPVRLVGLVLLGVVTVCLVAMASWSVDDPSFSYATSKAPANWLGFPGAAIADGLFQVFGLAALALLVPPALWGWAFARRHMPTHMGLRALAWIAATVLVAGVLSFVAMPASWPLPTGLGGLVGNGFTLLAALVTGEAPQAVTATLFAIIIAIPALAAFWVAMGLGAAVPTGPRKVAPVAGRKGAAAPVEEDEPETNPVVDIVLGALVHTGYSLRTAFRRARASHAERRAAEAASWRDDEVEPSLDGHAPAAERRQTEHLEQAIGYRGAGKAQPIGRRLRRGIGKARIVHRPGRHGDEGKDARDQHGGRDPGQGTQAHMSRHMAAGKGPAPERRGHEQGQRGQAEHLEQAIGYGGAGKAQPVGRRF